MSRAACPTAFLSLAVTLLPLSALATARPGDTGTLTFPVARSLGSVPLENVRIDFVNPPCPRAGGGSGRRTPVRRPGARFPLAEVAPAPWRDQSPPATRRHRPKDVSRGADRHALRRSHSLYDVPVGDRSGGT